MAIRRTDRKVNQTLPSRTALTDGGRFDLREGHDLERLLWPEAGSGGSTGLLENFAVDGRHPSADNFIKLKFLRRQPEVSFSINHLRWISGLGF